MKLDDLEARSPSHQLAAIGDSWAQYVAAPHSSRRCERFCEMVAPLARTAAAATAYQCGLPAHWADDIAQEVFLLVFGKDYLLRNGLLRKVDGEEAGRLIRHNIFKLTLWVSMGVIRSMRPHVALPLNEETTWEVRHTNGGETLPYPLRHDLERLFDACCKSDRERRILEMHYLFDRTQEEIALELKLSQGSVSKVLDASCKRLAVFRHEFLEDLRQRRPATPVNTVSK